jgi:hypothetical protein
MMVALRMRVETRLGVSITGGRRELGYPLGYQYVVCPLNAKGYGELVGEYPTVAAAYAAAIKRNPNGIPYIHAVGDFPFKMFGPDDTRGMTWFESVP